MLPFVTFDHVQLAMPAGGEERARAFYRDLLDMEEVPKPAELRARGGVWFASGAVALHLGVDANFVPAKKAHPALRCSDLDALEGRLRSAGARLVPGRVNADGTRQTYVDDPFGNRLECIG